MFNSNSFGFVKVAYVAGYGNFHIIPHTIDMPKTKKARRINPNQGVFLTQMWRESGRKVGHVSGETCSAPYTGI